MKTLIGAVLALTLMGNVSGIAAGVITDQKSAVSGHKPAALKGAMTPAVAPPLTISVDHRFTQQMADRAGLDKNDPELSADGVRSGTASVARNTHQVASSECLIVETVIRDANHTADDVIKSFCEEAKFATATQTESVKAALEEHAGTVVDDAIIHIVHWKNSLPSGTWYHYDRHAGAWTGTVISFSKGEAVRPIDHLLGHTNVAFLAIHLGIDDSCKISYDVEAKETAPLNRQDLTALIGLAEQILTKGTPNKTQAAENFQPPPPEEDQTKGIGVWGGQTLLQMPKLPASITLTPRLDGSVRAGTRDVESWEVQQTCAPAAKVAGKQSAKADSGATHTAALKPATSMQPFSAQDAPPSNNAGQDRGASHGAGAKASDPLAALSTTVPNEGLHWWDVSVSMPVTSYKNLRFDSQNNLIVTKNSNDLKPYALFDFFPRGTDLQATNALTTINLSAGVPIASRPLQKPFVGAGFTLAIKSFRLRPLVGVRIQKEQRTTTLVPNAPGTAAQLSADLHSEWHAKLQVMIGFSVADARKALGLK